jgi:hypothetical protein
MRHLHTISRTPAHGASTPSDEVDMVLTFVIAILTAVQPILTALLGDKSGTT